MFSTAHLHPTSEVSLPAVKLFWLIKLPWASELRDSCCSERDAAHGGEAAVKLGRERILPVVGPCSSGTMVLEKQKGNFQKFHFGLYHQKSVKEKICFPPTKCGILVAESLSARRGNVHAILLNSVVGMARNANNVTLVAQPYRAITVC